MTDRVVIDASAALTVVLSERGGEAVADRLRNWRRRHVDVLVPSHFWLEVANVLVRRHRLPTDVVVEAIHRIDAFGLVTVEVGRPMVLLAVALAERHGLSQYDAAYLALAQSEDTRLLSADSALLAAAGKRAIPVIDGDRGLAEEPAAYAPTPSWASYRETAAFLAKLRADAERTVTVDVGG